MRRGYKENIINTSPITLYIWYSSTQVLLIMNPRSRREESLGYAMRVNIAYPFSIQTGMKAIPGKQVISYLGDASRMILACDE